MKNETNLLYDSITDPFHELAITEEQNAPRSMRRLYAYYKANINSIFKEEWLRKKVLEDFRKVLEEPYIDTAPPM